jgi:hypothetical protein
MFVIFERIKVVVYDVIERLMEQIYNGLGISEKFHDK